jgi:hypothetical protein
MAGKKLSTWQQCKSIQETLTDGNDANAAAQRVRNALLEQLASTGERGVVLAAKLSRTNGPIPMEEGDMEVLELMKQRMADKAGIKNVDGHLSIDAPLLK